jgi:hypothetical protein
MILKYALSFLVMIPTAAQATSIDWAGGYRFEWTEVDRPSLTTPGQRKAYGLHHLYLSPRIIASDGVNIYSKFHILGSQDSAYQYSQAGDIWGGGLPRTPNPKDTTDVDSSRNNVFAKNQRQTPIQVSQLYLTVDQENGVFFAGRMPLEFGLGMTYNLGNGPFDHWLNSRDMVGFKFLVDNITIQPMFGRQYDENYGQGNNIQDQMIHLQYDNKDSGNLLGLLYEQRKGSVAVNDAPLATMTGTNGPGVVDGDFSTQRTSFMLGKSWSGFAFKFEGSFLSGSTGIKNAKGNNVKVNGYGLAAELYFPNPSSNVASQWEWKIRIGLATGDDPTTDDYEGFQFDKNYDVAFLMFNHRLGQKDFFSTNLVKDTTAGRNNSTSIDDEAIGNAAYFSPQLKYMWSDKFDLIQTVTAAQLIANPTNATDFNKTVGLEYDVELLYKMRERVSWSNQIGLFFPGAAFKDGQTGLETANTWGLASRIAITF